MADVRADPEKLRQLAKTFSKTAEQMQQLTKSLARALDSSGWQDAERQKFEQELRQTVKSLDQFAEKLKSQYAPLLQKKASALDQYRGR